jgi:hypothetical protein
MRLRLASVNGHRHFAGPVAMRPAMAAAYYAIRIEVRHNALLGAREDRNDPVAAPGARAARGAVE